MKKIRLKAFFKQLSKESPGIKLFWISTLKNQPENVVATAVCIHKGEVLKFHSHQGEAAYGTICIIDALPGNMEWVEGLSVRRTLHGPSTTLRTLL